METNERKVLLRSLVGSHNYGLSTPESDKDYKVFVMPSFDDLYDNERFKQATVTKSEDLFIHDIRVLANLLFKSNINFVEVLFSIESTHDSDLDFLFEMRDEIAKMNLPYLYNACKGMCFEKLKAMPKGTEGTEHLVAKYGYDTKNGLHAYRVLNFCYRYAENGFTDFKEAITYNAEKGKFLLDIKHGLFKYDEMVRFVEGYRDTTFAELAPVYGAQPVNEELNKFLHDKIKDIVRKNLIL